MAKSTVKKYRVRLRKPRSPTWKAFLNNHLKDLVSMDFFVVPTVTYQVLFVLVILAHERRRIVHCNVTEHLTAAWTAQQVVEREIGSIRRELFDDFIVLNERHLQRILQSYLGYYHGYRTHRALDMDTPIPRPRQPPELGRVREVPEVGGLHHHYERIAA